MHTGTFKKDKAIFRVAFPFKIPLGSLKEGKRSVAKRYGQLRDQKQYPFVCLTIIIKN